MPKSFKKLIAVILIAGVNYVAIFSVGETAAFFSDAEISEDNIFAAGILDFSLSGDDFTPLVSNSARVVEMNNFSTLPFEYQITIKNVSGNLCDGLNLTAMMDGIEKYNGSILENQLFPLTPPLPILNPNPGEDKNWNFIATFTGAGTPAGTCSFDFEYNGRQDNIIYGGGFSDTEEISNFIAAGEAVVDNVKVSPLLGTHKGCCGNGNEGISQEAGCSTKWYEAPGLYYKRQLNITWNADSNGDLLFDIVYITDNDCSGDISGADERFVIENDKPIAPDSPENYAYTWTGWTNNDDLIHWSEREDEWWKYYNDGGAIGNVPYFYGYAWIEIIAAESRNFMISDSETSVPMFEPLPPGLSMKQIQSILKDSSRIGYCPGLDDHLETGFETNAFATDGEKETDKNIGMDEDLKTENAEAGDIGNSTESENENNIDHQEEFLTPKEKALPDDEDFDDGEGGDDNKNEDEDEDKSGDEDINNASGESNDESGINKKSVDSVQAIN